MMKMVKKAGMRILAGALAAFCLWGTNPLTAQAVTSKGAIAQGVDVSKHNGSVNWAQVGSTGMKFTFIKVGSTYSGIDPNFDANIRGAQAAGIKTGVYIYSYATTPEAAQNEANLVLQWIDGYTVNFPVVFDLEDKCHKNLSSQQLIDIINAFCTTIDAAGYYPMVYSNKNMFVTKLGICGWDKWVAQYNSSCEYDNNVCFWQYSSHGSVNGFGSRVDVNYQYKNYDNLIIPEGFIPHGDQVRFYSNWRMQRGWVNYNDTRYYLDALGNLLTGWFTDMSGTYYLSPTEGGSITRGQAQVDGGDYYFTADGVKMTGWVVLGDQKFYYDPLANGVMKREWFSDEKGNFYFFDRTDGHALTGVQTIDNVQFCFNADGIRQTGFVPLEDGTRYYDPATGQLLTGFIQLGDKTYFADEAGHIVTGIYEINKQNYYFDETGVLIRNQELELNGVTYTATPEGVLVEVEAALADEAQPAEAQPAAEAAK